MPPLGSLAGLPDLTSDPARWVLANRYAHDPIGLDGNDDSGTLSAWYLWAAVGWFPVAGTDDYAMATVRAGRVDQPDGKTWVMRAPRTSARRYVADLKISGERITTSVVDHATLMSGEVVFDLSEETGGWVVADPPLAGLMWSTGCGSRAHTMRREQEAVCAT